MLIIQIIIFLTSGAAIWLVSTKGKWQRWGYICGLAGQPFWIYSALVTEQWGILLLSVFYAVSWSKGIYNYWVKE